MKAHQIAANIMDRTDEYSELIYEVVQNMHRLGPVRTAKVAIRLYMSARTARRHLRKMEQRGYVGRYGQRGGWYPKDRPVKIIQLELPLDFAA